MQFLSFSYNIRDHPSTIVELVLMCFDNNILSNYKMEINYVIIVIESVAIDDIDYDTNAVCKKIKK